MLSIESIIVQSAMKLLECVTMSLFLLFVFCFVVVVWLAGWVCVFFFIAVEKET